MDELIIGILAFVFGFVLGNVTKFEVKSWVFRNGKNRKKDK